MTTTKKARATSREPAVDRRRYAKNELQFAVILGQYHVKHWRRLYEMYQGDLVMPMILGEIAFRNVSGIIGEQDCFERGIEAQLEGLHSSRGLRPCNASSIALSTGVPRETVRRKLAALERDGYIVKEDDGFVLTKKPQKTLVPAMGYDNLLEFVRTYERIARVFAAD